MDPNLNPKPSDPNVLCFSRSDLDEFMAEGTSAVMEWVMIIFLCNARGAVSPNFTRVLKDYVSKYKPDLVTIQETRCRGTVAHNAIKKSLVIDAQGFSGGIWLMWNNPNLSIQEISKNEQPLHISISDNLREWFLTIVYDNPNEERKRELRNYIVDLVPTMNCPWMLCGDFNDISDISEKKGGAPPNLAQIRHFRDWMDSYGFMDLGFQGTCFTLREREREIGGFNLFQETNPNRDCNIHTQTIYPKMEPGYMLKMRSIVEADEIEQAIFFMGSLKAPGEDGFHQVFIKIIGN
ncbi:hypothetical protein Ahy_A02g006215 [Arachis hypogaea]|uniref:Endonuclease/exonuclease/phosphatase domain-containing protein n=1 Tax=Arachis hypogaea TaxID=3818 RepID=A0A445E964_ARAHY|nr:hypothetical protein Ahy_A02g006215 [Arachis hypogaea]